MKILAVDTSTPAGSVTLVEDTQLIATRTSISHRSHAERILPAIRDLLAEMGLSLDAIDLFAAADGPGSFTGLRIGLATMKGLAWSTGKPVLGVSTLEAMAENLAYTTGLLCPMLDARKKEVYAALFEGDGSGHLIRVQPDGVISPEEIVEQLWHFKTDRPILFWGEGAERYKTFFQDKFALRARFAPLYHGACIGYSVAKLCFEKVKNAEPTQDLTLFSPRYLRPPEAEIMRVQAKSQGWSI